MACTEFSASWRSALTAQGVNMPHDVFAGDPFSRENGEVGRKGCHWTGFDKRETSLDEYRDYASLRPFALDSAPRQPCRRNISARRKTKVGSHPTSRPSADPVPCLRLCYQSPSQPSHDAWAAVPARSRCSPPTEGTQAPLPRTSHRCAWPNQGGALPTSEVRTFPPRVRASQPHSPHATPRRRECSSQRGHPSSSAGDTSLDSSYLLT